MTTKNRPYGVKILPGSVRPQKADSRFLWPLIHAPPISKEHRLLSGVPALVSASTLLKIVPCNAGQTTAKQMYHLKMKNHGSIKKIEIKERVLVLLRYIT